MISSISLRSPRKTCGLFDIGFAGGDLDVTSLDLNAPADLIDNPFSLDSLKSVNFTTSVLDDGGDAYAEGKLDSVPHYSMDTFDMLEPLADLETDQLMDDSLDAFINLEQFLNGDTFFDVAEVKPFIDIPTIDSMTLTALDTECFLPVNPVPKSRKRKVEAEPLTFTPAKTTVFETPANVKSVKTSLFEIPFSESVVATIANPEIDHDYTTKHQRMSATLEIAQKPNTNGNSRGKATAKSALSPCEPSTSSCGMFSCSEEFVSDKQAARRQKNNVASKKSREQRKQKFADLDQEAEQLIEANEELRRKIVELEQTAKEMKALLVAKMTGH